MKKQSYRLYLLLVRAIICLFFGSLIPVKLIAADSTSSLLTEINQQLDAVPVRGRNKLSGEIVGGESDQLSIGSQIWYSFKATEDCFALLIVIDSEGTVTIARPWDGDHLPGTNVDRLYPEPENLEVFVVEPPTGLEHVYAFCTDSPLKLDGLPFEDSQTRLDDTAARTAIRLLVSEIYNRPNLSVTKAYWSQRVVGREGVAQYSTDDVVSYFTVKTRGLGKRKLPLEINFKFGSAELTRESQATLDRIGTALQSTKLANSVFRLGGHTDSIGSDEINQSLSELRAQSTRNYLRTKHNIDDNRLQVAGYGEHLPKADNGTPDGRQDNRRVELEKLN